MLRARRRLIPPVGFPESIACRPSFRTWRPWRHGGYVSHVPTAVLLALLLLAVPPAGAAELAGCDNPPVILIVVDTLRADRLGVYGYRRNTAPALSSLARSAAVFERAYATSPWTLPTMGSLYTGLLPAQHGAGAVLTVGEKVLYGQLRPEPPTIGEALLAFGYPTHAVAGNPNLHARFGVARGFASYDYEAGGMDHLRRADVIVDRALAWIAERHGAPFFLLVHIFDPHMNYDPPAATRGRFTAALPAGRCSLPFAETLRLRAGLQLTDDEQRFVGAAYDEEIAFVDEQMARFAAGLRALGVWQRAVVVFTADHGEELWDHGGFEHGHTMYDELLRVPLLVWGPGVRPGRIRTPVSLADVAPTLLDALGAPPLPGTAGISLWPLLRARRPPAARPLVAESPRYGPRAAAIIRWPHKLIADVDANNVRLFDLAADPGERRELKTSHAATAAALRAELDRHIASSTRTRPQAASLDDDTRERLRALGYLE